MFEPLFTSLTEEGVSLTFLRPLHSCLTIKRKAAPGAPGYRPSPAEVARKQGKADEPIKEDGVPVTHEVDKTGRKVPTEVGVLKRQKGE